MIESPIAPIAPILENLAPVVSERMKAAGNRSMAALGLDRLWGHGQDAPGHLVIHQKQMDEEVLNHQAIVVERGRTRAFIYYDESAILGRQGTLGTALWPMPLRPRTRWTGSTLEGLEMGRALRALPPLARRHEDGVTGAWMAPWRTWKEPITTHAPDPWKDLSTVFDRVGDHLGTLVPPVVFPMGVQLYGLAWDEDGSPQRPFVVAKGLGIPGKGESVFMKTIQALFDETTQGMPRFWFVRSGFGTASQIWSRTIHSKPSPLSSHEILDLYARFPRTMALMPR